MLEYWSIGKMGLKEFYLLKKRIFSDLNTQYSTIPSFHHSRWAAFLDGIKGTLISDGYRNS